jgi:hypothetical protein
MLKNLIEDLREALAEAKPQTPKTANKLKDKKNVIAKVDLAQQMRKWARDTVGGMPGKSIGNKKKSSDKEACRKKNWGQD